MRLVFFALIIFSFSFSDDRTLWGCHDSEATNYNPWSLLDCGDWCCEYADDSNADFSSSVIINEINYNPASSYNQHDSDYEFIELYNASNEDINLHGWFLSIDHNSCFTFPDVSIESHGFLVLARNTNTYPNSIGIGSDNALSNSGGTITIRNPHYDVIDEVHYDDTCNDTSCTEECWPTNSDAGGSSLELIDFNLDNNLASSWQDSFVIPGGTPGAENSNSDGSIYGCTDSLACNYNENATYDNGLCYYADSNFDCDGNCLVESDCAGNCGGDLVFDDCGVCGGNGIEDGFCDCEGNQLDCAGNCGGDLVFDVCGTCGGNIDDLDSCPILGYSIGYGDLNFENNSISVFINNESSISGFQFDVSGFNIVDIQSNVLSDLDFTISNSESTIIGFSLSGGFIAPSNQILMTLFFDDSYEEQFCLSNTIFSGPNAESLDVDIDDCYNVGGCTDSEACNFGEFVYSCSDCCNYGDQYWLDTDGDGLGFANDVYIYCEDPGTPWVQNHGDEYPNCFSNFVDECGICDGDNSSCSGCLDDLAFNSNCLNGNWPDSAVFGCDDEVVVGDDSCLYPPNGFDFDQSTTQAFYKFIDASFDNEELNFMGSWIGAFRGDTCVGSWPWVGSLTTVPVMGNDGFDYSADYMLEGEIPDFYIYDSVSESSYKANITQDLPWINFEIYHVDNLYYSNDCDSDNSSQLYDECNVCGGDGFLENCLGTNDCSQMDCLGVCGGDAQCESDTLYGWNNLGYVSGDVNLDFNTNVIDVTNQVNIVLDNHSPNFYEFWAADMNQDFELNVIDVVCLSGHILGLLKSSSESDIKYFENNNSLIGQNIGGIQFDGHLSSKIEGNDIYMSNQNGKSLVYNLNGILETKEFIFKDSPSNLIVSNIQGESLDVEIISAYGLGAFPNPFNPTTTISFNTTNTENVKISVFDIYGKELTTLINNEYPAGSHETLWNASNFSSGAYIIRMQTETFSNTQKVMLVK